MTRASATVETNYIHANAGRGSNEEQRQPGTKEDDEIGDQIEEKCTTVTGIEGGDQNWMALISEVENIKCVCCMICY